MKLFPLLLLSCLAIADCHAQLPDWTQSKPAVSPIGRTRHAIAFDSDRKVTVLFGGRDLRVRALGDTWEWNGKTWTQFKPALSPTARSEQVMVYDSLRKVMVLFGGIDSTGTKRDTWTWNGKVWFKFKIAPTAKPSARDSTAMVFDASRGRVVLFSGYDLTRGLVRDVWEFNGVIWTKMSSLTTSPIGRVDHAMAYDSIRKRTVLFGGVGPQGSRSDTWEWNGVLWTPITPATTSPSARRCSGGLAYDSARRRTVLFGGSSGTVQNDTWEYNGKDWQKIATTRAPQGRENHRLAFDSARGKLVLFGGTLGSAETWEYSGGTCHMSADVMTISMSAGGTQTLSLDAGPVHANRPYWIFGSITGTTPGIFLNGIHIPLNVDIYTQLALQNVTANPPFKRFRSVLDAKGEASAEFVVPAGLLKVGFTLFHSYVVFDSRGVFHCASNPVSITFN